MNAQAKEARRSKPRRRFVQYRIRTLFSVTTLAIAVLVLWRGYVHSFHAQRAAAGALRKAGATVSTRPAAFAALRAQFGEGNFQHVVHVDLSGVELTDELLDQLVRLGQLETLGLAGENLGDAQLYRLRRLRRLRHLLLDSTSVTAAGVERLQAALPGAQIHLAHRMFIARLRENGVVAADVDGAAEVRALFGNEAFERPTDVWLSDAAVDAVTLIRLRALERLRSLELQRCDIGDADLAPLDALENLTVLNLGGTQITDESLSRLGEYVQLERLYLYSTHISDAGLPHLKNLANLHELYLENTAVTRDGVARLQQALPETRISY